MNDMEQNENPWEDISLEDYEAHMSLDSVRQLQLMNAIMKEQFGEYPVNTAMVLGVAGGNGLEHVQKDKYQTIYGVDINEDYLRVTAKRYQSLGDVLKCLRIDLINEPDSLPNADLVIANLLIEYIGYPAFQNVIKAVNPTYVSCVIQINTDEENWVSDSPYLHAFDRLDEIHNQMEENALEETMKEIGYQIILRQSMPLPNGKELVRMDFKPEMTNHMNNLILIGMPASGKSTVGVILAKILGMSFLDTDLLIQQREGMLLRDIIDQRGVDAFLKCEEEALLSVDTRNTVIATGGSVVYSQSAMEALRKEGTICYLKVEKDELFRRLKNVKERGVVLQNGESLDEMYENRSRLYEECADIVIPERDFTIEETVQAVICAVR